MVLAALRLSLARQRGDVPRAIEAAQQALEPAAVSDAAKLGVGEDLRALTLLSLGFAEIEAFRIDEAGQHLSEGLTLARRTKRPLLEMTALSRLAGTANFGSLAVSVARANQAIEIAKKHGWTGLPVVGLAYWAQSCLVWQGRLEEAEPLLDLAELGQQPDVEPAKALAIIHTRTMIDLLRDKNDAALKKLLAGERLASRLGPGQVLAGANDPALANPDARAPGRNKPGGASLSSAQREGARRCADADRAGLGERHPKQPAAAVAALAPVLDGSAPVASAGVDGMHAFLLEAISRDMLGEARLRERRSNGRLTLPSRTGCAGLFCFIPSENCRSGTAREGRCTLPFVSDLLRQVSYARFVLPSPHE